MSSVQLQINYRLIKLFYLITECFVDEMWKPNIFVTRAVLSALCMCLLVAVYTLYDKDIFPASGDSRDLSGNDDTRTLPKLKNIDKIKHIAFLKVPKTGSSTLACIFLRFGIKNKLNMYLPKSTVFVSPKEQRRLLGEQTRYDIFVMHTIYDSTFFTHIVSRDSAVIGLVREPTHRIISHAFYKPLRKRKEFKGVSEEKFIHTVLNKTAKYGVEHVIAHFFGMKEIKTKNDYIHQYLENLNSNFSLVLVLERFNESLVLLKRILNWSFADILYGARKVNTYDPVSLSEKEKQNIYSHNILDFKIYNYFKTELEHKIKREGNDFQGEVLHFENILNSVKTFCDNTKSSNTSKMEFPSSNWDRSFVVLSTECELIFNTDVRKIKRRY